LEHCGLWVEFVRLLYTQRTNSAVEAQKERSTAFRAAWQTAATTTDSGRLCSMPQIFLSRITLVSLSGIPAADVCLHHG
jgi:hypothetical protein